MLLWWLVMSQHRLSQTQILTHPIPDQEASFISACFVSTAYPPCLPLLTVYLRDYTRVSANPAAVKNALRTRVFEPEVSQFGM